MSASPDRPTRGRGRTLLILVAFALGIVAVLLVVIGDTRKEVTVGALLGAWSALLGGFTLIGPRPTGVAEPRHGGRDVELRSGGELERERDVAGRREYELQLEMMLRRELQKVLREELSALRNEVAGLRNDLVEKVNGQLRLERIETTRVIGSDIEALQHEVRRLAGSRELIDVAAAPPPVSAPPWQPVSPPPRPQVTAAPPPVAPASKPFAVAAAASVVAPAPQPFVAPAPRPIVAPAPPSPVERPIADLFADLPRLGSFPVDESEPSAPAPSEPSAAPSPPTPAPREPGPSGYVGRRRDAEGAGPDEQTSTQGTGATTHSQAPERGGRRRRADGQTDDVLGRLIGR